MPRLYQRLLEGHQMFRGPCPGIELGLGQDEQFILFSDRLGVHLHQVFYKTQTSESFSDLADNALPGNRQRLPGNRQIPLGLPNLIPIERQETHEILADLDACLLRSSDGIVPGKDTDLRMEKTPMSRTRFGFGVRNVGLGNRDLWTVGQGLSDGVFESM